MIRKQLSELWLKLTVTVASVFLEMNFSSKMTGLSAKSGEPEMKNMR